MHSADVADMNRVKIQPKQLVAEHRGETGDVI